MHAQRDTGTYAFIPTRVSLSHRFENAHCNAAAVTLFAGLKLELVTEVVWEKNTVGWLDLELVAEVVWEKNIVGLELELAAEPPLELVAEVVWEKNSDMVDDNTPDFDL